MVWDHGSTRHQKMEKGFASKNKAKGGRGRKFWGVVASGRKGEREKLQLVKPAFWPWSVWDWLVGFFFLFFGLKNL